jgi:hypothetical protein
MGKDNRKREVENQADTLPLKIMPGPPGPGSLLSPRRFSRGSPQQQERQAHPHYARIINSLCTALTGQTWRAGPRFRFCPGEPSGAFLFGRFQSGPESGAGNQSDGAIRFFACDYREITGILGGKSL